MAVSSCLLALVIFGVLSWVQPASAWQEVLAGRFSGDVTKHEVVGAICIAI